jgi:hypothetical protein
MLTSELRIVRRIDPHGTPAAAKADDADAARIALEAHAQFDGPERTVHVRLAEHAG